jgi:hypothetical protein
MVLGGFGVGQFFKSSTATPAGAAPPNAGLLPLTSWNSYASPWNNAAHQYPGCGSYGYSGPGEGQPTSGGVSSNGHVGVYSYPGTGCTTQTLVERAWTGTHTSGTYTPTSTGTYTFTATWHFTIAFSVYAQCGSSTAYGVSLNNYATLNVTTYFALYDNTANDGQTVPNTFMTSVYWLDSRDQQCVSGAPSSWGNPNAAYAIVDLDQSFSMTCQALLNSANTYAPRAAFQMTAFAYGDSGSGGGAGSAQGSLYGNNIVATLTSVSVS